MKRTSRSALVLPVVFALTASCGEQTKQTASATASARPICKESPSSEYEPRCKAGERDCCALLVDGKFPTDPASVEAFGTACSGGHLPACTIAREADRPPRWKLDVFTKACAATTRGEGSCRTAALLGFVLEPDKIADHFAEYCKHTDNAAFMSGEGGSLTCPSPGADQLAALKPHAIACADGAVERCGMLAGSDGNGNALLRQVAALAWKGRGLDPDQTSEVLDNRAPLPEVGAAVASGSVGIVVTKSAKSSAKPIDAKALRDAVHSREDVVRKCIGANTKGKDDLGGKVSFDVIVDGRGTIAATTDVDLDLKGATYLSMCARGAVQDAQLEGVKAAGRGRVELTLKK